MTPIRVAQHPPGTAPGTLSTPDGAQPTAIDVIAFSETELKEFKAVKIDDLAAMRAQWPMMWIDVQGLRDQHTIEHLGEMFGLHRLALEDVLSPYQRPKIDDYGAVVYIAMRMAHLQGKNLVIEPLHLFLGDGFLMSFQEMDGDSLDPVRDRLRKGEGRAIRKCRSNYLAYALIDAVVDGFFPVLEHYSDVIDRLENDVLVARPGHDIIGQIHTIRRRLNKLRHAVWPMRDVVNSFAAHVPQDDEQTKFYLRDCADHAVQALDLLEVDRERASSLIEIYLSGVSNRMNEVVKVLTIISTVFMPLTFIVGVYGMNFDTKSPYNMPELHWRYGYPACWALMIVITVMFVFYFWRKGWLQNTNPMKK